MTPNSLRLRATSLALAVFFSAILHAKPSDWRDADGNKFRGEPTDVLGPFGVFRTHAFGGKLVPFRALKPDACVKFYNDLAATNATDSPEAAASPAWSGVVARAVAASTVRFPRGEREVPFAPGAPEPRLYVLVYATFGDWFSLNSANTFLPTYRRIQQVFPGQMEAIFCSAKPPAQQTEELRKNWFPWLFADTGFRENSPAIARLLEYTGPGLIAVTPNGVPLFSAAAGKEKETDAFIDQLSLLMQQISPLNSASWGDAEHYLRAVRPVQFARGTAAAALIGQPLRPDGLARRGISGVDAELKISADGAIEEAVVAPGGSTPDALLPALADALKKMARFAPAIENGRAVPGQYRFSIKVSAADSAHQTNADWLASTPKSERAIERWLLLKTFKVPSQESAMLRRHEDGTVELAAFDVGSEPVAMSAQKAAFAKDWFATEEAASLAPADGKSVVVGDEQYVWRAVAPKEGLVDIQSGGKDEYCYAYAWTEITVDRDQDALLGLGSDDGVKIWINGAPVYEKWQRRPRRIYDDVVRLPLKKGSNQLMLKVQNMWGEWGFKYSLRLPANAATAAPGPSQKK